MMLMPILVIFFGPQPAVPIMAIGAVMGNLGRVCAWRSEIDWRALAAYCSTSVPGAALGVHTLLALPPHVVDIALGAFFIGMIPTRRWIASRSAKISLLHLAMIGGPWAF
ncbi:sulfite exporter TauE/SafE family protein [Paraburkholderia sp.]|uniref:sulfite exporter TauE/SafE family protein n=1 Tax=Paraburkholderia sp. TaxID=1926495 RepID=UPI0023925EF0|nr:sulfite exporter TauE/SafE family protein [Paraburkholderia sp.]MDE1180973.1 sulfite exporter TauE/SafE family protein [Paraburkholderia sp.]